MISSRPVEAAAGRAPLLPLRVHDLKQWTYCPRIVFFHHVMPVEKKPTFKMVHGNEAEAAIDRLEKRRKLTEFGLAEGRRRFHVWLASERLGLSGKLDLLIETAEERFPVDFKFSEAQVHSNHRVQLAAYALLLEERTDRPVEEGFVYLIPREEIVAVPLSAELKAQVVELLAVIRTAIVRQVFPEPTAVPVRCENCEFANFCADVF